MSRRSFHPLLFMVLLSIVFFACKKDSDDKKDPDISSPIIEEQNKRLSQVILTAKTEVILRVLIEDEDGNPLSAVQVTAGGETATTDKEGYCLFEQLSINKDYALIAATKTGYLKGSRTIAPTAGAINTAVIALLREGSPKQFSAAAGAALSFDNDAVQVSFPPAAIADAQGKPYTGSVRVYARYLDPREASFSGVMPGTLVGLSDANQLVGMISYGMLNLEMRDGSGNPLQLAAGQTAEVTMPAILDAPTNMPVWHFNESFGVWVEAGRARKNGSTYSFEANHFSAWNLDIFVQDAIEEVTIEVVLENKNLLGNQRVEVFDADFSNRLGFAITDESGRFRLLQMPRNLGFRLITDCEEIDRSVGLTTPTTRVNFTLNNLAKRYTVEGMLKDCGEVVYKNALFSLSSIDNSDIQFTGSTDAEGKFSITTILCDVDTDKKYTLMAQVFLNNSAVKRDAIQVKFSSGTLTKDIDFCNPGIIDDNPYLNPNLTYGILVDPRDGQTYATIAIGTQTWMAQNLAYLPSVHNNADYEIRGANSQAAYGVYDYDGNNVEFIKTTIFYLTYGVMYNWHAVLTACPPGWHLPSQSEWDVLVDFLGGLSVAGGAMKSTNNWRSPNTGATNSSGFSGLPGGHRLRNGWFGSIWDSSSWWSSSETSATSASVRELDAYNSYSRRFSDRKSIGYYCRCIKD